MPSLSDLAKKCKEKFTLSKETYTLLRMEGRGNLRVYLRRFRFEAGEMTQQELARRVGVTRQTIISIEKGKYQPSIELALRLAQALDVSVDQIFRLRGEWRKRR